MDYLSNPEHIQSAGTFPMDLMGGDLSGDPAMMENQLERSYHDGLGKRITDLTANGTMPAIYYVSD